VELLESTPGAGPLALVVRPEGNAELARLPDAPGGQLRALNELLGGYLEAVATGSSDWVCYINEEGKGLGLAFNVQADALVRTLGFRFMQGDYLVGVAVFLGRNGPDESDVPQRIVDLAKIAGIPVRVTPSEES
jgi:hypothetical protein